MYLYDIVHETGKPSAIRCHLCGKKSYSLRDVEFHYCGNCHVFLDDEAQRRFNEVFDEHARLLRLVRIHENAQKRTKR